MHTSKLSDDTSILAVEPPLSEYLCASSMPKVLSEFFQTNKAHSFKYEVLMNTLL